MDADVSPLVACAGAGFDDGIGDMVMPHDGDSSPAKSRHGSPAKGRSAGAEGGEDGVEEEEEVEQMEMEPGEMYKGKAVNDMTMEDIRKALTKEGVEFQQAWRKGRLVEELKGHLKEKEEVAKRGGKQLKFPMGQPSSSPQRRGGPAGKKREVSAPSVAC
jgi:hypothetical protein